MTLLLIGSSFQQLQPTQAMMLISRAISTSVTNVFLKGSKTKSFIPVIRTDNTLFWRTDTPTTASIPSEVKINTNEIGDMDCWYEKDLCMICGLGGCVSVQLKSDSIERKAHFKHDKFSVNMLGTIVKDYVVKVFVIQRTNFFFTIENMNVGGAGLLRWDSYSNSCYDKYEGKETGLTNHFYHMRHLDISRVMGISIPEKNKFLLFDIRDISAPVKEFVFSGATNKGIGPFDFYDREPAKMIISTCIASASQKHCWNLNYLTGAVDSTTSVAMDIGATAAFNSRRAAVKYIPQDWMYILMVGGLASTNQISFFVVNSKLSTMSKYTTNKELIIGTVGEPQFIQGGTSDVIMSSFIPGMYFVNSKNVLHFYFRYLATATDFQAFGCHPNCFSTSPAENKVVTERFCNDRAHDPTQCFNHVATTQNPCDAIANRQYEKLRCSLKREGAGEPHLGLVNDIQGYFPMTFANVTCTGTAKNFTIPTNDSLTGLFSGNNLIWLISIGTVLLVIVFLALFFALSSAAGPKFYRPTPHSNNLPSMQINNYPSNNNGSMMAKKSRSPQRSNMGNSRSPSRSPSRNRFNNGY